MRYLLLIPLFLLAPFVNADVGQVNQCVTGFCQSISVSHDRGSLNIGISALSNPSITVREYVTGALSTCASIASTSITMAKEYTASTIMGSCSGDTHVQVAVTNNVSMLYNFWYQASTSQFFWPSEATSSPSTVAVATSTFVTNFPVPYNDWLFAASLIVFLIAFSPLMLFFSLFKKKSSLPFGISSHDQ